MYQVLLKCPMEPLGLDLKGENVSNAYTEDVEIASEITLMYIKLDLFL